MLAVAPCGLAIRWFSVVKLQTALGGVASWGRAEATAEVATATALRTLWFAFKCLLSSQYSTSTTGEVVKLVLLFSLPNIISVKLICNHSQEKPLNLKRTCHWYTLTLILWNSISPAKSILSPLKSAKSVEMHHPWNFGLGKRFD